MIPLNITWAMTIYLSVPIIFVFIAWMFYTYHEEKEDTQLEYLYQCSYCTYLFFSYTQNEVQICPRCKSYVNKETNVTQRKTKKC